MQTGTSDETANRTGTSDRMDGEDSGQDEKGDTSESPADAASSVQKDEKEQVVDLHLDRPSLRSSFASRTFVEVARI